MRHIATVPTHFILRACRYAADMHPAYAGITLLPMMILLGRELASNTEGPQAQSPVQPRKSGVCH